MPTLQPSELASAQTYIYVSDYVEVVDYNEITMTNTVISISNVINISFSTAQPNVTINVGDNKIWFNGYYTTGESEGITWVDSRYAPEKYGNDIANTPVTVYTFGAVPPREYLFDVTQPNPRGITVTHNFTVNYSGGNTNFTIDRYVYPSIYQAYTFLANYEWYTEV